MVYSAAFGSTLLLTVPGATHGGGSKNLLVTVRDAAGLLVRAPHTVHESDFEVEVTFGQLQDGTIRIVEALNGVANVGVPFTAQNPLTVPGGTHGLGTNNLQAQVYDTTSPKALLVRTGLVTIDPVTFTWVAEFGQSQSGYVVLQVEENDLFLPLHTAVAWRKPQTALFGWRSVSF